MKFKAKEKEGRLYVSATIHAARLHEPSTSISTRDVIGWVAKHHPRYKGASLLKKGAAYNGATQKERTGIWIFALKVKTKASPPPSSTSKKTPRS
jgi:hypothetical protein